MNSLANHGFLPRSGRNINAVQVVTGAFLGLGVSPETSGVVVAIGYASSHNIFSLGFDLEDLSKHMFTIEHDCSFSRDDYRTGDNNAFNFKVWKTALDELSKSDRVDPFAMGRAKSARVQAQRLINNETVYGPRAAAIGAIEAGMIMAALGAPFPGFSKLSYVRSIFEEERLPTHLGWKPFPFGNNAATAFGYASASLAADPKILQHAGDVIISSPADIIQTLFPPKKTNVQVVKQMIHSAGFDTSSMHFLNDLEQRAI